MEDKSEWVGINDAEKPNYGVRCRVWTTDADGDPIESHATWNGSNGFLGLGGHKDKDVTHWQYICKPRAQT